MRLRGLRAISASSASTGLRVISVTRAVWPQVQTGWRGAQAVGRLALEGLLDDAIFQAVKADDRQPPAGPQQVNSAGQGALDGAQLVIDRDPQRLKGARSRMNFLAGAALVRALLLQPARAWCGSGGRRRWLAMRRLWRSSP
jgi:hypothetical protein